MDKKESKALRRPFMRALFRKNKFNLAMTVVASMCSAGVNLVIEPGETVALMGATGCGKTTLAMLVPRFYDAEQGRVLVDGLGRGEGELTGRTRNGRLVHLKGDPALIGRFLDVEITGGNTWALYGKEVNGHG